MWKRVICHIRCKSTVRQVAPVQPKIFNKSKAANSKSESGSPFDGSFTFQLFLIVGAMGAGYTLGKTSVINDPPADLFPKGSTTSLKDISTEKENTTKLFDKFKRCVLRVIEAKGIQIDVKYGENQDLFKNEYFSKDVAELMNDQDSVSDLFFGKKEEIWKDKSFIFYPESTKDVSDIAQLSQEFEICLSTADNLKLQDSGLEIVVDYSRLNRIEIENTDESISVDVGANLNDIKGYGLNGSALDLFLTCSGITTQDMSNRMIAGFAKNLVTEFTAVLPDGSIVTAKNDQMDEGEYKSFQLLSQYQNMVCLITNVKLDLSTQKNEQLVVMGFNNIAELNKNISEVKTKLKGNVEIAVVDNNSCEPLAQRFGDYKTFAAFKVTKEDLSKLNKRYCNGEETESFKITCLGPSDVYARACRNEKEDDNNESYIKYKYKYTYGQTNENPVILATPNILNANSTFQGYGSPEPVKHEELHRRVKLALDRGAVVNRGAGVAL